MLHFSQENFAYVQLFVILNRSQHVIFPDTALATGEKEGEGGKEG
jgi:hypothetical protein